MCLVDTEASVSVISHKWLEIFSREQSYLDMQIDSLPEGFALQDVDGSNIHVTGSLSLVIRISKWTISHKFVVADVDIPGPILGIDFLSQHAVVLDLKKRLLRWAGGSVPLKTPSVGLCFLAVRHSFTMPDTSRRMIKSQIVDSEGRPCCLTGARVIEPNAGFVDKTSVMVARALVDGEQGEVPVQLLNLRDTSFVKTGAVLAELVDIEEVSTVEQSGLVCGMVGTEMNDTENFLSIFHLDHLGDKERNELSRVLLKYRSVFSTGPMDIGTTGVVKHKIPTGTAQPVKQLPRRIAHALKEEVDKQVTLMLDTGIVSCSNSPWSSPVVLVKKRDGVVRFCIDYRRLKAVTVKNSYPLPRIDDTLDELSGARYFTTLDLAAGYWQVPVAEEDKKKTAFVTQKGLWQFNKMPFGLANAPATFQRMMEVVLAGLQWPECLIYLDDVIVFSSSFDKHMQRLD